MAMNVGSSSEAYRGYPGKLNPVRSNPKKPVDALTGVSAEEEIASVQRPVPGAERAAGSALNAQSYAQDDGAELRDLSAARAELNSTRESILSQPAAFMQAQANQKPADMLALLE